MSASEVCTAALRSGLTPPEIATSQGLALSTVLEYLDRAVGAGQLARADIYFSMPRILRAQVEEACRFSGYEPSAAAHHPSLKPLLLLVPGATAGDVQVCARYGPANRYYGDLYEIVRRYEIDAHGFVRDVLQHVFGVEERAWWYQGVPLKVRQGCVARAEELGRFDLDPWNCTYLLDVQAVVGQQWTVFAPYYKVGNKNEVMDQIRDVNDVRNRVMHPVRDAPPTESDFDTLRLAYQSLVIVRARFYGSEGRG